VARSATRARGCEGGGAGHQEKGGGSPEKRRGVEAVLRPLGDNIQPRWRRVVAGGDPGWVPASRGVRWGGER
jgi:hypothetical protein